ncbi:hypothetical protein [Ancylobacter sp. IITR112]|uniref:hypothetical protein n=1 Tax=Ancylobacter sp. IITR112 TaxID=3138073 RepID=UPI00352B23B2
MALVLSYALVLADPLDSTDASAPVLGWHSVVQAGGILAEYEAAGYPASNLATPSTAEGWRSTSAAEQTVTFAIPGGEGVDYVGIERHNLGSIGCNLSLEIPDPEDEGEWIELAAPLVPAGDAPLMLRFPLTYTGGALRFRLAMPDGAVPPEIAVVYIGRLTRIPRGIQPGAVPIRYAGSTDIVTGFAESGDYLGRIVTRRALTTSVSFRYLPDSWFRANMDGFARASMERPFFFCVLPALYPGDVGYGVLKGDLRPEQEMTGEGVMVHITLQIDAVAL